VVDVDETCPYPESYMNLYAETKAHAEQAVLAASGLPRTRRPDDPPEEAPILSTCAIRPCGMYGEGDPYHVANVLRVVREGNLPVRPGNGKAAFEHVYVGNVAHAHVLAMKRLAAGDAAVAGSAYFITDDTPAVNFLVFMEPIVEALGYSLPPRSRTVPYPVMLGVGALMEGIALLVRPFYKMTPTLTRSSVRFVCHDHTFNGDLARRELGYEPVYKHDECMARTIRWWQAQENAGRAA
jgi:nucleoside-diphosphate-sugar epimerase